MEHSLAFWGDPVWEKDKVALPSGSALFLPCGGWGFSVMVRPSVREVQALAP